MAGWTRLALIQSLVERPLDVLVEMRLVLLDGQHELASPPTILAAMSF